MSIPINYLRSLSWKDVKIKSGLWGDRVRLNRDVVLDYQYEQIEKTGRVDNFRRASGKKSGKFEGLFFNDSDTYKWIEAAITLDKDRKVTLNQYTNYPWSEEINIRVSSGEETSFTLFVRIPGWCQEAEVLVNGKSITGDIMPSSYFPISRTWKGEDEVQLNISMPVEFLRSHPHSSNNARLAISRGPTIYCIETEDHPGIDVFDILLSPDTKLIPHFESGLLGGVVVLKGEASVQDLSSWRGKLYRPYPKEKKVKTKPLRITAIPYFAWANRSPGKMLVWFREMRNV